MVTTATALPISVFLWAKQTLVSAYLFHALPVLFGGCLSASLPLCGWLLFPTDSAVKSTPSSKSGCQSSPRHPFPISKVFLERTDLTLRARLNCSNHQPPYLAKNRPTGMMTALHFDFVHLQPTPYTGTFSPSPPM